MDEIKKYKPLKGQLALFVSGIKHLEVEHHYGLRDVLDHFTFFGKAKQVHVLYPKTKEDVENIREWILDVYHPKGSVNDLPYIFPNEYWVFWKSDTYDSLYCQNLGMIIKDIEEDLDGLKRLAKSHLTT